MLHPLPKTGRNADHPTKLSMDFVPDTPMNVYYNKGLQRTIKELKYYKIPSSKKGTNKALKAAVSISAFLMSTYGT
jgi:hypothetical protein